MRDKVNNRDLGIAGERLKAIIQRDSQNLQFSLYSSGILMFLAIVIVWSLLGIKARPFIIHKAVVKIAGI